MNLITNKNQLEFSLVEKTVCRGAYPNTHAEPHNLRPLHTDRKGKIHECPTCKRNFIPCQESSKRKSRKRFCSTECSGKKRLAFGTITRFKDTTGKERNLISLPGHPSASKNKVLYARWVMEKRIRRFLLPTDIVHHMNGNQLDDRVENLRVFKSKSDHHKNHFPIRINSQEERNIIVDSIFEVLDIYNPFPDIPRELHY